MIRRWIFRGLLGAVLLGTVLGVTAYYYPEKFLCVDSGKVTADVIVVLGGGSNERPLRAVELYKAKAAPRILLTGSGDDEINRRILLRAGVPASVIEVESQSETTSENARFSLARLRAEKVHSVILVTSWYHARRAQKTFEHYAPELKIYSRPSYYGFAWEDWQKQGINKRMRLEFLKLPGYWIRYGVNPF